MFASRKIAQQFLEYMEPGLKHRLDSCGDQEVMREASKAFRVFLRDYPAKSQLVDTFVASAIAGIPSIQRADSDDDIGLALAQIRKMSAYYKENFDDGRQIVGILAEVPISTALSIERSIGDGAVYRKKEKPEDYHITLAYLGRYFPDEISGDRLDKLTRSIVGKVASYAPLQGGVTGYGRMKGSMADGAALYVSPKLKGLVALRQLIKKGCEEAGFPIKSEYDFIPHITVGFMELDSPTPMIDLDGDLSLTLKNFSVKVNKRIHSTITLTGDTRLDERMDEMMMLGTEEEVFAAERRPRKEQVIMQNGQKVKLIQPGTESYIDQTPMKSQVIEGCQESDDSVVVYMGPNPDGKVFRLKKTHEDGAETTCLMVGFDSAEDAQKFFFREMQNESEGMISMREPSENKDPLHRGVSHRSDAGIRMSRRIAGESTPPLNSNPSDKVFFWQDLTRSKVYALFPWKHNFPDRGIVFVDPIDPGMNRDSAIKWILDSVSRQIPLIERVYGFEPVYNDFLSAEFSLVSALMAYDMVGNFFADDFLTAHSKLLSAARKIFRSVESEAVKLKKSLLDERSLREKYAKTQFLIDSIEADPRNTPLEELAALRSASNVLGRLIATHSSIDFVLDRLEKVRSHSSSVPTSLRQMNSFAASKLRDDRKFKAELARIGTPLDSVINPLVHLLLGTGNLSANAHALDAASLKAFESSEDKRISHLFSRAKSEVEMYQRLSKHPEDLSVIPEIEDQPKNYIEVLQELESNWQRGFGSNGDGVSPETKARAITSKLNERVQERLSILRMLMLYNEDSGFEGIVSQIKEDHRRLFNDYVDLKGKVEIFSQGVITQRMQQSDFGGSFSPIMEDSIQATRFIEFTVNKILLEIESKLDAIAKQIDRMGDDKLEGRKLDEYFELSEEASLAGIEYIRNDKKDPDPELPEQVYQNHSRLYGQQINNWVEVARKWVITQKTLDKANNNFADLANRLKLDQMTKLLEQDMVLTRLGGAEEIVKERDLNSLRLDGSEQLSDSLRFDRRPPYLKMPFTEAVNSFKGKEILPSFTTTDIPDDYHNWAFMVSGVTRGDLLSSIKWLLERAIEDGTTEEIFHRQFNRLVGRKGWRPNSERVQFIFVTNMRSAYSDGRYRQIFDDEALPDTSVLLWRHGDSPSPRPNHLALNNKAIPKNHRFWKIAYPACAYGCKCRAIAITRDFAERRNYEILKNPPDPRTIAEEGWRTNPSQYFAPESREKLVAKAKKRLHPSVKLLS